MSFLLDLFTNNAAQQAANAQEQALAQGLSQYTTQVNAGNQNLTSNYMSALQPWQQIFSQGQQGTNQLQNVLGLNGAAGNQSALSTLQSTPGYQFQLQQGDNAVNAAAAANGTLNSGNQLNALSQQNQGLANTTYNNYVNQLQPYLNYSTSAASGIGNTYTGLGNQLNANNLALGGTELNVAASQGNAQANADLAANQAGANLLNLFGGVAGLGVSGGGTLGGNFLQSLIASDERLKKDIEPVGELYDGQKVYSYKYTFDPDTPRIGLLAQEVEQKFPEAVEEIGGFKAVDYGRATDYAAELGRLFADAPENSNDNASEASNLLDMFKDAA